MIVTAADVFSLPRGRNRDRYACAPTTRGLGAVYDWDAIENAVVEIV